MRARRCDAAGKSSALEHLIGAATREGFDVLTAPEVDPPPYVPSCHHATTPLRHHGAEWACLWARGANARPYVRVGARRTTARTVAPRAPPTPAGSRPRSAAPAGAYALRTRGQVATLYFNSSYQFPSPLSPTFDDQKFAFQRNILKLQLQMERCYTELAGSTTRPTIVVFDRGMRDCQVGAALGAYSASNRRRHMHALPPPCPGIHAPPASGPARWCGRC